MRHRLPDPRPLPSLDDLTDLMAETAALRRKAAAALIAGGPLPAELPPSLAQALADLDAAADRDGTVTVTLDAAEDQPLRLPMAEEIHQLENDLVYLSEGREALLKTLAKRHHGLRDMIRRSLRDMAGQNFGALVCDCDALLRAPGQRFATAVQPAWNAVAITRFAMARARKPVLWSDAPLSGPGIADLAVVPPRTFAFAASLGRECRDPEGAETLAPLSGEKAALLESINARLAVLLADPLWRAFACVGSGFQFRRGETVIARQDANASVDEDASLALLENIHNIIDAVDPERQHFRVDDDGLDVSVTPTASTLDLWRDYSPTEGLRAADTALGLDLSRDPTLVCCAGTTGLALLTALAAKSADLRAIFVADRDDLGRRALDICPKTAVVPHPDIAAAIFSAAAP